MLQFMRGNSDSVSTSNPVLAAGQPFYELDSHKLKIGDGSSNYSDLPYVAGGSSEVSCPFPVHSTMIFTDSTDPNSIWVGTTWVKFAEGQTLIGMSSSDTEFNALGKTGGAKSISLSHTHTTSGHALTTSEMPSHSHTMGSHTHTMNHTHSDSFRVASHTHTVSGYTGQRGDGTVDYDGDHWHKITYHVNDKPIALDGTASSSGNGYKLTFQNANVTIGNMRASDERWTDGSTTGSEHYHRINLTSSSASPSLSGSVSTYSGSTGSASGSSGSTGSGNSHSHGNTGSALSTQSVLQPYVVVCFWQRTA